MRIMAGCVLEQLRKRRKKKNSVRLATFHSLSYLMVLLQRSREGGAVGLLRGLLPLAEVQNILSKEQSGKTRGLSDGYIQ